MLLQQLEAVLGSGRISGSEEYQFNCPFCLVRKGSSDDKHHLYVNPHRVLHGIKGWYYCHRCQAAGPLTRILKGYKEVITRPSLTQWQQWLQELKNPKKAVLQTRKVELPEDYVPCFKGTEAYDYLKSRAIDDSIIADYKIGYGIKNLRGLTKEERRKYAGSGRIIFPDFDSEGCVVYWVARTYKGHTIKYKNPPDSDARDKVYNLANAVQYRDVVITEGVISAIAAGRNAVATYGKDVTPTQVAMLVRGGFDRYYVALDGDALKRARTAKVTTKPPAIKLAKDLAGRGCAVLMVLLPYEHDPASVPNFMERLKNAKPFDFVLSLELLMAASR